MRSNSKITRIFLALQKAQGDGVLESDLMVDWEKSGNVRLIKHRLNKLLESDAVSVVNGTWYLSSEYWNMTRAEFNEILHRNDILHMHQKNNLTILGIICILVCFATFTAFVGYEVGKPNSLEECGFIFDVDISFE